MGASVRRALIILMFGSACSWCSDEEQIPKTPSSSSRQGTPALSPRVVFTLPLTPSPPEAAQDAVPAPNTPTTTPNQKTAQSRGGPNAQSYQPVPRPDGRHVVALDIGHTPTHPGCFSATGTGEYYFNKRIVALLAAKMRESKQFEPVVINPNGAEISLYERTRVAARAQAELFLAIHHDAVLDKYLKPWEVNGKKAFYCDDVKGFGVFMSKKNPQLDRSLRFAKLLGSAMIGQGFEFSPHHSEPVAGENRPILDKYDGVYEYDD